MAAASAGGQRVPFLAADVGGTHARIGLVSATGDHAHPVALLRYATYECARFASLGEILRLFLSDHALAPVCCGSIACAGYPEGERVINSNLPWPVSIPELRAALGVRELALINDFQAMACATEFLHADDTSLIAGPDIVASGPVLVMGPGTGLGAAVRVPTNNGRSIILTTEAGQAAFAPSTPRELAILDRLLHQDAHVPVEQLVSGPGLHTIYRTLGLIEGSPAPLESPARVTSAAIAGNDALARDALDTFCGLLGSVVGDLILLYGAQGGVFMAGGILPQIHEFLRHSSFHARLLSKGPMRSVLAQVPVRLIEHGNHGVIGAASWFLQHRAGVGFVKDRV
jgi:glucokinase